MRGIRGQLAVIFVLAAFAVAPTVALAGMRTTAPGYNFSIQVIINAKGVTLNRSVARRGWLAHFVVHNDTKQPHSFEVGGRKLNVIGPGKTGRIGAYLENRGQFDYRVDNKLRGYFQVV